MWQSQMVVLMLLARTIYLSELPPIAMSVQSASLRAYPDFESLSILEPVLSLLLPIFPPANCWLHVEP